jgi:hypothetical protein
MEANAALRYNNEGEYAGAIESLLEYASKEAISYFG